jgi:hypothetical protein
MDKWQPVRLAPIHLWHNITESRKKQAAPFIGDIFRVRPIEGFGPCGCPKFEVEPSYSERVYRATNREPLPVVICFECEILAD